ncbi:MAG: hypothetical protein KF744_14345 [Taibaiella sp.]|nr:hypothetical protein [Taibaiella sp.]
MNNRFLGNAPSLLKMDLVMRLAREFSLPVWYITMITESRNRNKGDRNATNYRLGSQNQELLELMKEAYYGENSVLNDITEHLRTKIQRLKVIAVRNNQRSEHYRAGYLTHFTQKDRTGYFSAVVDLLDKEIGQLVLLDPDNGVLPSSKKAPAGKGNEMVKASEIKMILDMLKDDSIVMVHQALTSHLYSHQQRVSDLKRDLSANVLFLVDEVIQAGVFFVVKLDLVFEKLSTSLTDYISTYQFVKSSDRVMLIKERMEIVEVQDGQVDIAEDEQVSE